MNLCSGHAFCLKKLNFFVSGSEISLKNLIFFKDLWPNILEVQVLWLLHSDIDFCVFVYLDFYFYLSIFGCDKLTGLSLCFCFQFMLIRIVQTGALIDICSLCELTLYAGILRT